MAKPLTPKSIPSAAGRIEQRAAELERLAATLDPDYPAAFVLAAGPSIDEPAERYDQVRARPDFVRADDEGWA